MAILSHHTRARCLRSQEQLKPSRKHLCGRNRSPSALGFRQTRHFQGISILRHLQAVICNSGSEAAADQAQLVDLVLSSVEDTDGGNTLSTDQRLHVNSLLSTLENIGKAQQPRPLANPIVFGNYNVVYTASADNDQPAGGRFRTRLGRTLFQTTGVYQSVLEPDLVINKVSFKVLGLIPGYVGLRGKLKAIEEGQDTVRVFFDPPVLSFADAATFSIGPPSQVVLKTTYLDERVRLGKGGSGSLFVFTRGGAADAAGMEKVGTEPRAVIPQLIMGAMLLSVLALCTAGLQTGNPFLQVISAVAGLFAGGLSFTLIKGGLMPQRRAEQHTPPTAAAST